MGEGEYFSQIDADRVRRGVGVCIVCGYNLRGLPSSHCCPECGLEFDALTEVLRPQSGAKLTIVFVIGMSACMGCFLAGPIVHMIQAFGAPFGATVLLLMASAAIALIALQRKRRPFIMLAPKGVFYRTSTRGPLLVGWDQLDRVETPLPTGGFRNERHLYLFVAGVENPHDLSGAVSGVGFADRARAAIMAMRDRRLPMSAEAILKS